MSSPNSAIDLNTPVEELPYELALSQLELIVSALGSEGLKLDESLKLFERGQSLIQHCTQLLDNAELRIQQIMDKSIIDVDQDP